MTVTVLDTNVLSELMRRDPDAGVIEWLGAQPESTVFTTAITQAEILFGLALLPSGKKRRALQRAADAMFEDFEGRVLPFDGAAAAAFAEVAAVRRSSGSPISNADAQIAAIVRVHGARLATRNVDDFRGCGIDIVDPWTL